MHDFISTASALRVHAGRDALAALPSELSRAGVRRPIVLSGWHVHDNDELRERVAMLSPEDRPPWYAGLGKEAPLSSVLQAVEMARAERADGLVAVGAGSVLKAARVVAILLAEDRPVQELITRYPEHGPAVSPRLMAPKLPILNVLTAPTTAQFRSGSAIAVEGQDQRYEFFDPKTRARAVFWDAQALMSSPGPLILGTGAAVYWRALMSMAAIDSANPLVAASRLHAWKLAREAMASLVAGSRRPEPRIDLCAASLLQVRDEDDGGAPMQAHWTARLVYALGAALFTIHPSVSQAGAYAALTGGALRTTAHIEPLVHASMARALGLTEGSTSRLCEAIEEVFSAMGQPTSLCQLGLRREDLPALREFATKNFNADRQRDFRARTELLDAVLASSWAGSPH